MNEDVSEILKRFVKDITNGNYDTEFAKIYRNSEYISGRKDLILRENDYSLPLCINFIKTDMLLAVLKFQENLAKKPELASMVEDFKKKTLNEAIWLRNITEERVYIEEADFYNDFTHLGLSNFYKIEDYIDGVAESSFIVNLIKEINEYKSEVEKWVNDYTSGSYKLSMSATRKADELRKNVNRLSKKIEYVEIHKMFNDLVKMERKDFIDYVGNESKNLIVTINNYNLEMIDYVDKFINVFKTLNFDEYKNKDYKQIVSLKKLADQHVFKRHVSNDEEKAFFSDIISALARKIAKTAIDSPERKEINQYYSINLNNEILNKVNDEVLLYEYEEGLSYTNKAMSLFKIETTMKRKLLDKLFEDVSGGITNILLEVNKKIDFFRFEIVDFDTVKLEFISDSKYLLDYNIIEMIEDMRKNKDINVYGVIDILEDYKLKAKLPLKSESEVKARLKV